MAQGRNLKVAELPLIERPWRDHLSGAASYAATLTVREGQARLRIESSLRGVASSLPAPLAKAAGDALPLRLEIAQADGGARDRVSATLGRLAAAELLRRRQGEAMVVQRAGVAFSPAARPAGAAARAAGNPGLRLARRARPRLVARARAAPAMTLGGVSVDMRVGTLDLYGKRVSGLTVRAGTGRRSAGRRA